MGFKNISSDYLYTIIKNNRYNILSSLRQTILGKEVAEEMEIETKPSQKCYAKTEVYTKIPQFPRK